MTQHKPKVKANNKLKKQQHWNKKRKKILKYTMFFDICDKTSY